MESELDNAIREEARASHLKNGTKPAMVNRHHTNYKLGEVVGKHGVRNWGQWKSVKGDNSAMFICPLCDNSWRALVTSIVSGATKCCGCKRKDSK